MKKIMFFATFVVAMMMASCGGSKTETSTETFGAATDTVVEVVDDVTVAGDSLVEVVETDTVVVL